MEKHFDAIIIGSGPGGYVAAIRCAQLGMKTAIIEKEETLGGTCLNVGCIPSKALLQSSEDFERIEKQGKSLGIEAKSLSVDFKQMMKRKDEIVSGLVNGVGSLMKKNQIERVKGIGTFISSKMIEVKREKEKLQLTADHFIIATGSIPIELPFMPFDEKHIVSSTGALSLKKIPKSMIVIGGGVIGVELASVYNRLGSEVKVVEMLDRICPLLDRAMSKAFLKVLKGQGIAFHLSSKVKQAEKKKGKVFVEVEGMDLLDAETVLVSVGRKAYTENLGLDQIELSTDKNGHIPVNGRFQTAIPHIYAIGDVINGPQLAHKASEEGVAAAEIIAGNNPHINYSAIPNVIYTHPEMADVGLTEEECRAANLDLKIGTYLFKGNPRARCASDTDGLVKIIGEKKSDRLLGMHILGPHASEMIMEGVVAIEKKATITEIANASHAHPTLTECIKEAALNALERTIHL